MASRRRRVTVLFALRRRYEYCKVTGNESPRITMQLARYIVVLPEIFLRYFPLESRVSNARDSRYSWSGSTLVVTIDR